MSTEEIKNFILGFHRAIQDQDITQITNNYENNWGGLTEKLKDTHNEWPPAEKIALLVEDDEIFLYLYKELYFRHLYSKQHKQLTLEQRFAAWENYSAFFEVILGIQKKPLPFELPVQWIWDITDEFVYQYQEFCQYRSKFTDRTPQEINKLKESPQVWNTVSVLKYLYRFISKSSIINTLERERSGGEASPSNPFALSQLYQYFGYFSIIGLCRLHCILGDYYMALKSLEPIDIHKKKSRYTKVTAAYISLYYYAGFSYMMVRRYQDAIKMFTSVLLYISRMKQYFRQYDQKTNNKMYALLAILLHFCPKRIDEHINNILRQDHATKVLPMQSRDSEDIRETEQNFSYGCPKFVSPAPPNYDEEISLHMNAPLPLQRKLFVKEINQQTPLPTIRSYLKLYSTIDVDKLANLLQKKHDKDTLRTYLLRFIYKNRQLQWTTGMKPNEGNWASSTNLDFYIDGEMIHVIDNTVTKRYGEVFLRNCNKLEEIISDLEKQQGKNA